MGAVESLPRRYALTTIAKRGDAGPAGTGQFLSFSGLSRSGPTTAFTGSYIDEFGDNVKGIFSSTNGATTTIAKTGDDAPANSTFYNFDGTSLDHTRFPGSISLNTVAFRGEYDVGQGIFTGTGGAFTTFVKTGDAAPNGTFTVFGDPALSESSAFAFQPVPVVAFVGIYTGGQGVFVKSGNNFFHTVATTSTLSGVGDFGDPYLLNEKVAFRVNRFSGTQAIYYSDYFFNGPGKFVSQGDPVPGISGATFTSFGDPVIVSGIYDAYVVFTGNYSGRLRHFQPCWPDSQNRRCIIRLDGSERRDGKIWRRKRFIRGALSSAVHVERWKKSGVAFVLTALEPGRRSLIFAGMLSATFVRSRKRPR